MMVLKSPQERWDPRWSALIVVDVQNDFARSKGAAALRGGDLTASQAMVARLIKFIDVGRRVGLTIIYIQTLPGPWTDTPSWIYRKSQGKGLNRCAEGTWGA